MPFLTSRPFLKVGVSCATAVLLLANATTAQAHTKSVTIDDNVLSLSDGKLLAAPSFDSSLGTLTDVSLILKLNGQSYTLFDTDNADDSLVNLFVAPYPANAEAVGS